MANNHLIGKQVLELNISTSKNAYAIQQRVSDLVWKAFLPEICALFDTLVGEEEVLQLDSIVIDLGEVDIKEANIPTVLDAMTQLLEKECSNSIAEIRGREFEDAKPQAKGQLPLRQHYFQLWLHWLEFGTLPSYANVPKENWLEKVFETLGLEDAAIQRLQAVLIQNSIALRRLILQHKAKELKSLVELYTGYSQSKLLNFFKELSKAYKHGIIMNLKVGYRELEVALWQIIFQKVILRREKLTSETIAALLMGCKELSTFRTNFKSQRKHNNTKYPILSTALKDAKINLKSDLKKEVLPTEGLAKETLDNEESAYQKNVEPQKIVSENLLDTTASPQFIKKAGMVLLHPFLSKLFRKLKLAEDGAFNDFKSQCKAVLLLRFLAGGENMGKDFELLLPKILCGMPANLPLDHTLKLSKKEKKEANNLLKAVIDHWGALGSTSPDGLREGFLIREGKLTKEESGRKLYVEQKAIDVLLDRLPWNLSMIKLPWMKELLYVEWR
ncbi:contractile injection system tape measure protein [Zobellia sp. 1_MG-2023]|uniref:contractile injection system tape measure protein n=1 Tax=Zobellia sp. 1_MG-2023 TaxID=3062626 RepID=UPI0026E32A2E|nr:contractile injection system tape measure protein [Zobellia sp. 1_MG-2023]MDO6818884.1 contractile injection system tape measure protein [Zobellia sp. 1_MG-2023]